MHKQSNHRHQRVSRAGDTVTSHVWRLTATRGPCFATGQGGNVLGDALGAPGLEAQAMKHQWQAWGLLTHSFTKHGPEPHLLV